MHLKGVKPLNLDHLLHDSPSKPLKNRIAFFGVELEGGWKTLPPGVNLIPDSSVRIDSPPEAFDPVTQRQKWRLTLGELPSTPQKPGEVGDWMRKFYPSHVNESCGLHVHMSFHTALHYSWLMVPEFPASVLKYVAEWSEEEKLPKDHPIWPRLRGENTACQHLFHADLQVSAGPNKGHDRRAQGHRYTVVGYPWPRHTTIEHRILPGFEDKEQGVRAVLRLADITNAALMVLGRKEKKLEASVLAVDGTSVTSYQEGGVEVGRVVEGMANGDLLMEELRVRV